MFSEPFKFEGEPIEYCIGMTICNDNFVVTYSTWDNSSKITVLNVKDIVDFCKYHYEILF